MPLQMETLRNLRIRTKLLVLPGVAAVGLLIVLITSILLADREEGQIRLVENDYYPSVQLSAEIESRFATLQRALQDAVASRNASGLEETDALHAELQARI